MVKKTLVLIKITIKPNIKENLKKLFKIVFTLKQVQMVRLKVWVISNR